MKHAKPNIRLFVPVPFAANTLVELNKAQSHYLANVMRLRANDAVSVFNGTQGEWLAHVDHAGKKSVTLVLKNELARQRFSPDIWLAFAPIKNKTELVVEKATELGVSKLLPVLMKHSVVKSVNMEKLKAHAIEAAEQCERHDIPEIAACQTLQALLANWPKDRTLLYGDESGKGEALPALLAHARPGKYGLLIGPEGGFSAEEHRMLASYAFVKPFGMGPRILRADTAAVAALACVMSKLGDWHERPHFMAASA